MKIALILLFLFSFSPAVLSQEKPITQTEYVKMLYSLEKNPAGKADLIDALRRRGIAFQLTDGLRGFTRSKGRNDEELKRALEEAERRRQNPEASKLPGETEISSIISKTRSNTIAAIEEMPDFVVKELITRSDAYAGTGNWKTIDNVIVAVSYSSEKGEQYRVLAVDGAPVNAQTGGNYSGLSGSTTSGEFVETLARLFRPEYKTEFTIVTTDVLRGRPAYVFEYEIKIENNPRGIGIKTAKGSKGFAVTSVPTGEKGRVWIDKGSHRVLRIEWKAVDLPASFEIKAFDSLIDYDWVEIAGEKYLLPIVSDNKFTSLFRGKLVQDRNLIRFRSYQRYGSEVKIVEEDTEPVPDEKPNP